MNAALDLVREQLAEATAAKKCHSCGCLHQTVSALSGTRGAAPIAHALERARSVFVEKRYDCLGCSVCYPALAANAFADAFPQEGAGLDLCPAAEPEAREGWPPLPGDHHALRFAAPVAVCTLNDEALAAALARLNVDQLAIVGTLRTENLGIERLMKNVLANPNIRRLVICGDDSQQAIGHLPGQTLLSLLENGVDDSKRIRGAKGKRPVLKNMTDEEIDAFRKQVTPVTLVGEHDAEAIVAQVVSAGLSAPGRFEAAPSSPAAHVIRAVAPTRLVPDPNGYLVVYPDPAHSVLRVEHFTNAGVFTCAIEAPDAPAVSAALIERGLVSRLDHAAYLGRELARAEHALASGTRYVQDRAPGRIESEAAPMAVCGCTKGCGE